MSKTIWGISAAVIAAIIAAVLAASQGLLTEEAEKRPMAEAQSDGAQRDSAPAPESPAAGTTEGDASVADQAADAETGAELEEEAQSYVEQLGEPRYEPIQMESASGFAAPEQTVAPRDTEAG